MVYNNTTVLRMETEQIKKLEIELSREYLKNDSQTVAQCNRVIELALDIEFEWLIGGLWQYILDKKHEYIERQLDLYHSLDLIEICYAFEINGKSDTVIEMFNAYQNDAQWLFKNQCEFVNTIISSWNNPQYFKLQFDHHDVCVNEADESLEYFNHKLSKRLHRYYARFGVRCTPFACKVVNQQNSSVCSAFQVIYELPQNTSIDDFRNHVTSLWEGTVDFEDCVNDLSNLNSYKLKYEKYEINKLV